MISIEEIKQMVIKSETEWIEEIHEDEYIPMYVNGMIDDINGCKTVDDIVDFYITKGFDTKEGFEIIIKLLRENTQLKD